MPPPTAAVASSARRVRNAFRACLFVLVIMAALVALLRWSDDVPPPEPLVTDLPRTPLTTLQGIVGEADTRAWPPPLARVDEGTSEAKSAPLVPTTSAATEPLDQASSSAPVATKARVKWYCLMPVGDSLTQGVGAHGSYRAPLLSRLTAAATSVARVGMTGTRRYPCTPRRPGTFYMDAPKDADDGSLHEGYCNWDSGSIYQQLESRTLYGEASRTPGADCGGDGAPVRYHTALLMMGHNDVFKAAKGCRVPERCEATWVPKNSPHDNGVHSLDTPELLAPYMRCAIAFLRKNFKRNLYNASTALLRRASAPPTAVSRWLGMGGAPALVIGKNPSTGFPCLDVVLYKYIDEVVSDLRADFEQAVKGQDGTWTRRVAVAQFPGFKKGDHTFDSTHPNRQGADLLADGWIAAIESGTFY